MCGINGGYNVERKVVETMVSATAHRGPDATGIHSLGPVIFGHNRLAIIDVDTRSNQPMISSDGKHMLVFNGEIYNFLELKNQLTDWNFKTSGDTEVLLAALITWGVSALDKIHGIFSFAWYNYSNDELILARDHLGVKPLYYHLNNGTILFSSELSGMLAGTKLRNLNQEALAHYFSTNLVPPPLSLVQGINKLPPGHVLRFNHKGIFIKQFYSPSRPTRKKLSTDEIRSTIGDTVKQQLVSDRPTGVFLSGGLDSSIVLHHAAENMKVNTFSTSFEMVKGEEMFHERFNADAALAAKTAAVYDTNHTEVIVSLDLVRKEIFSLMANLDEPVPNPVTPFQTILCRTAREKGIVVAFGGDGGDELWGGYDRHRAFLAAQYFQLLPKFIQLGLSNTHPRFKSLQIPVGEQLHRKLTIYPDSKHDQLFKIPLSSEPSHLFLKELYSLPEYQGMSAIDTFMRIDRNLWLANDGLHRLDRASMAVGVEVRVPLLGMPIVELADSLRSEAKFTPFQNKQLLRKTYQKLLPNHLFNQPKRGWSAPGAMWFRDEIISKQIQEICSESYYDGLSSVINWSVAQDMLKKHTEFKGYFLHPLWNIIALQIWARENKVRF